MFRVREYSLCNSLILEDITILSISDVHSNVENLIEVINYGMSIGVDCITIAGDLFDSIDNAHNEEIVKVLKRIKDVPIFICNGNHDLVRFSGKGLFAKCIQTNDLKYYDSLNKEDGICVFLNNDGVSRFKSIEIVAYDAGFSWYNDFFEDKLKFKEMLNEYLKGLEQSNTFRLLLTHSCNGLINSNKLENEIKGINLVLSGHNHAGVMPDFLQKHIPKNRGIIGPYNKWFMSGSFGYWTRESTSIILNNGLTKMGTSHGSVLFCNMINEALKGDVDVIRLHNGKNHELKLISKSIQK